MQHTVFPYMAGRCDVDFAAWCTDVIDLAANMQRSAQCSPSSLDELCHFLLLKAPPLARYAPLSALFSRVSSISLIETSKSGSINGNHHQLDNL